MLHSLKRIWLRLVLKLKRNGTRNDKVQMSAFEVETLKICRNLIKNSDTDLLVCPETGRRFIIFDPLQIKIILEDDKIILSNHAYYYELSISKGGLDNIVRVFNGNVKERRNVLEAEIKTNAKNTLNNIFNSTLKQA